MHLDAWRFDTETGPLEQRGISSAVLGEEVEVVVWANTATQTSGHWIDSDDWYVAKLVSENET